MQDLTWRLMSGTERLQLAPRVLGLLIGTNNVDFGPPLNETASMLDYLLTWLQVGAARVRCCAVLCRCSSQGRQAAALRIPDASAMAK